MTPCEALTRSRLANLLEAQARLLERHGRAADADQVRRDAAARRLGTAW
jgi:hypothetical protein